MLTLCSLLAILYHLLILRMKLTLGKLQREFALKITVIYGEAWSGHPLTGICQFWQSLKEQRRTKFSIIWLRIKSLSKNAINFDHGGRWDPLHIIPNPWFRFSAESMWFVYTASRPFIRLLEKVFLPWTCSLFLSAFLDRPSCKLPSYICFPP